MISDELPHSGEDLTASPRLFRNTLLDRFSRVHPSVPFLLYLPVIAVLLWHPRWEMSGAYELFAFAFGYLLWTLLEYFGHRFVFHLRATSTFGRRIQFLIHGVHHQHPSDPLRLVMPPIMSVPIMIGGYAILRWALGPAIVVPALAGFLAGYLLYDGLHFYLHHARPKTSIGRYLRRRHMHHHFRDDSSLFGVSAPWWDAIFATCPQADPGKSE